MVAIDFIYNRNTANSFKFNEFQISHITIFKIIYSVQVKKIFQHTLQRDMVYKWYSKRLNTFI